MQMKLRSITLTNTEGVTLEETLAPLEQEAQEGEKCLNQLRQDYETQRKNLSTPAETPELARLRRESVSQLPPTNVQVISLVVSRADRVLRCQPDPTIQPLNTPTPCPLIGPGF